MLSKSNGALLAAADRGYHIKEGILYSPRGKTVNGFIKQDYKNFKSSYKGESIHVKFHRLVAYQKYGEKIFEPGLEVRHLDGDKTNNLDSNIEIGTHYENYLDMPVEKRISNFRDNSIPKNLKHDADVVKNLREQGFSYSKIKEATGISSNGTINHILYKR